MSILTKPIEQITFEDVVAFCDQKHRESIGLDYKRDLSGTRLQEAVAAMANTHGGTILVGAEEDGKTGTPKSPAEGFDVSSDIEDTIWRKIGDTIYPPVSPELRVVPPKDGKTFAVIRVRESELAPHQIILPNGERRIYVRTGSVNSLGKTEDATLAQIEWMQDRRLGSAQLRKRLRLGADDRFESVFRSRGVAKHVSPVLKIRIAPRYPTTPLLPLNGLAAAFKAIEIKTSAHEFPKVEHYKLVPGQECLTYARLLKPNADGLGGLARYVELDVYGSLFCAVTLQTTEKTHATPSPERTISLNSVLAWVALAAAGAARLFKHAEFVGLVDCTASIEGVAGCAVIRLRNSLNNPFPTGEDEVTKVELQTRVEIAESLSTADLQEETRRHSLVRRICHQLAWSLGVEIPEDEFQRFMPA